MGPSPATLKMVYVIRRNAILTTEFFWFGWIRPDRANLVCGKFRVWAFLSSKVCAVPKFVGVIVGSRVPSEIVKSIVFTVAVKVACFVFCRGLANECRQYKAMDIVRYRRIVFAKVDVFVAGLKKACLKNSTLNFGSSASGIQVSARLAANSPEVANAIDTFVADNRQPAFYNAFSHIASRTGHVIRWLTALVTPISRRYFITGDSTK